MSKFHNVIPIGYRKGTILSPGFANQKEPTRVRQPVKRTCGRVVGLYPSIKNQRNVAWESQMEQKACALFEFSQGVSSYEEQPIRIWCDSRPAYFYYTPDFRLTLATGEVVYVEIKPLNKLQKSCQKERFKNISDYWQKRNCGFILLTEYELSNTNLQHNLRILRSYQTRDISDAEMQAIEELMDDNSTVKFGCLKSRLNSLAKAYAAIAHNLVSMDLNQPIDCESLISYPPENAHETCLFNYRLASDL